MTLGTLSINSMFEDLLVGDDIGFADRLSRAHFNVGVLNSSTTPDDARIWYICSTGKSEAEQLMLLRKAIFDLRIPYSWIPCMEQADVLKLPVVGKVWALPIPASLIEKELSFEDNLMSCHKSLRLIKRRKKDG